jgi:hypothetical protein
MQKRETQSQEFPVATDAQVEAYFSGRGSMALSM